MADRYTNPEALRFHTNGTPGKVALAPTKSLLTQRDLALAYSPGVAAPCLEISDDQLNAYKYTAKGNYVAVISNGTAVLGLGNLGALASKPVMEGKSVLFKRFADIDSVDVEIDTEDQEEFINSVKYLGPSWGGINLEDIKAPECFEIERRLKEEMDIPVFHDDQHGTAIVTAAALINACKLTGRKMDELKLVVLGAGSAGIACLELVKSMGVKNALLVDRSGVIYKGRKESMNEWKEKHAIETDDRTLEDAMKNADAFYGLAGKGAVTKEMVATMAPNPIIFAMANPDPEITPEEAKEVRDDAIIATGRSDYPNQVNNVLGFPYIFRGALDTFSTTINEEMKVAAAQAIAELAREAVPHEVAAAYGRDDMEFGAEYIIPSPFDPRLIEAVPMAVAKAAIESGVARNKITDWEAYRSQLAARLNPTASTMDGIVKQLRNRPKTAVFAEGNEEKIVRAALEWINNGYGKAVLVGDETTIQNNLAKLSNGADISAITIHNTDSNFDSEAAKIVNEGNGDVVVTGLTGSYHDSLVTLFNEIGAKEGERIFGVTIAVDKHNESVLISDTAVHIKPNAEQLAQITKSTAKLAEKLGHAPRAALLSFSNYGNPDHEGRKTIADALEILNNEKVSFEVDGDITPDVALEAELLKMYPNAKLSAPANCLIMPSLEASNISGKLLNQVGGSTLVGPILTGFKKPAQIIPNGSSVSDILNIAAIGAVGE